MGVSEAGASAEVSVAEAKSLRLSESGSFPVSRAIRARRRLSRGSFSAAWAASSMALVALLSSA